MLRKLTASAAIGSALLTTGCFKSESKTTINDDGSGKFSMSMEMNIAGIMGMLGGAAGGGAEAPKGPDAKEMLVEMMRSMNPYVDVWTDAKAETTKMGATRVTMSGLTKDWTAMGDLTKALENSSLDESAPVPVPVGDILKDVKMIRVTKDTGGNTVITMMGVDEIGTIFDGMRKAAIKDGSAPKPGEMKLDKEEMDQKLDEFRQQYNGLKGMVAMFIKDMKVSTEIETGGTIVEAAGFKKTGEKSATWTMNGEQLMDMVDSIINDEELSTKVIKLVKDIEENFDNGKSTEAVKAFVAPYMKTMFGGEANPRLVIKPGAAAFDYAAEVEKAKAGQSPELKSLVEKIAKPRSVKLPGSTAPAADEAQEVK